MTTLAANLSAQSQLANLFFQPTGVDRGSVSIDILLNIQRRTANIKLAAESFRADGLVEFAEQIEFTASSEIFGTISAIFSSVSSLCGVSADLGPLGAVFGFIGGLFGMGDNSISEIKDALKTMETELVTVNNNLIKISKQISEGFQEISKEINQVINEIRQVEKDIEINEISRSVDEHLLRVNNGVSDFLNMLINLQGDSESNQIRRHELAQKYLDQFRDDYDLLLAVVAGSDATVSDDSFLSLLSTKCSLSQGNIQYSQWRNLVNFYLAKIHFSVINGCFAIAWAADNYAPETSQSVFDKYKHILLHYFGKIYSIEPGIFYPQNGTNIYLTSYDNSALQYTLTRAPQGDMIEIVNTTKYPVELTQLQIITNYSMSDSIKGFWGEMLYGGASWTGHLANPQQPVEQEVILDANNQPLFVCYTINYKAATFAANGRATLNMSFSSNPSNNFYVDTKCGLRDAAMLPIVSLINSSGKTTLHIVDYRVLDNLNQTHVIPVKSPASLQPGKRIVGCFTNYSMYQDHYFATDIPFNKLNIVSYCFAGFDADGNVSSNDSWADSFNLPALQFWLAKTPTLMAELLFGGWPDETDPKKNYLTRFRSIASDPVKRTRFATNACKTMLQIGFTGIGIDWEYPEPGDVENYILLLQELRTVIDELNSNNTLSVAVPAAITKIDFLSVDQWRRLSEAVDFINIMTYDYNGSWSPITDFNAPLYTNQTNPEYQENRNNNVAGTLRHFTDIAKDCSIPTQKLAIGLAAYGRALLAKNGMVNATNKGLYLAHVPGQEPIGSDGKEGGVFTYKSIIQPTGQPLPDDMQFFTSRTAPGTGDIVERQSAWGYSTAKNWFISFDSPDSIAAKMDYAVDQQLGGAMLWELSGDVAADDKSLLTQIYASYRDKTRN